MASGNKLYVRVLLAAVILGPFLYRNLPAVYEFAKIDSAKSATKGLIELMRDNKINVTAALRAAAKTCAGSDVPAEVTEFLAGMVEAKMSEATALKAVAKQDTHESGLAGDRHVKFKQKMIADFEKLYAKLPPAEQKKADAAIEAMGQGKWYETGGLCIIKAAVRKLKQGREAQPAT